jgi:flagellar basal body-associated protein FliL
MKKIIFGVLILGFIIAAVFVGYFVFNNSEPEPSEPIVATEPTPDPNPEPEPEPEPESSLNTL